MQEKNDKEEQRLIHALEIFWKKFFIISIFNSFRMKNANQNGVQSAFMVEQVANSCDDDCDLHESYEQTGEGAEQHGEEACEDASEGDDHAEADE